MLIEMILATIIAYLIGSLSSAIIVCKIMRLPDPRTQGSGNPGATNVLRIGGKLPAIITLLGDALKGFIPVLIAKWYGLPPLGIALVMFATFIGHLAPIFFRFEGGKGVATLIGCLFALNYLLGLSFILTWLVVALIFRYSSLAALIATILSPIYTGYLTENAIYVTIVSLMGAFLIFKHRSNIINLLAGKEDQIGKKKSH